MTDLRNAVPRSVWRSSVSGLIVLVAGVLLSLGGIAVAVIGAFGVDTVSVLYFYAGAIACYAVGYPLILSYARYFKKKS